MSGVVERAKAALAGVTPGPWEHHIAPHEDSAETPAEYMANSLIGDGEPLHALTAPSPDPKFAYVVPALTGDGPTSAINAEFIAQSRTLVPELIEAVEMRDKVIQAMAEQLDLWLKNHPMTGPRQEAVAALILQAERLS